MKATKAKKAMKAMKATNAKLKRKRTGSSTAERVQKCRKDAAAKRDKIKLRNAKDRIIGLVMLMARTNIHTLVKVTSV